MGLALVAGALAAYLLREAPPAADAAVERTPGAQRPAGPAAGPRGVEAAAPSTGSVRPSAVILPAAAPPKATLSNEYATARNLKALYDRLSHSEEGRSGEGQLTLYRILRSCANVTDRRGPRPPRPPTPEEKAAFLAALPLQDPAFSKRVAAYEQLSEDRCVGLSGLVTTEAELAAKLREAVAAGSPGARVLQVEQEMWQERRTSDARSPTLSDAQIEALKSALGSKDPEALVAAARILASNFRDLSVRVGPDGLNVEARALQNALAVTACDYGYACGDNNLRILTACANQGHCEAGNLPDFLQYYASSPHDALLVQQYRTALRTAIETGDWSGVAFVRGPVNPAAGRMMAGPGFGPR
jgi:hypothetical protein